jgi:hypothetical protein
LKASKGYNFFRRSLSIPMKRVEAAKNAHIQPEQYEREYTNIARPTSSAYVPEYPGNPWEHDPSIDRPSSAAYIPQHAASDFEQSIGRPQQVNTHVSREKQITCPPPEPDHLVNVTAAVVESDDSSGDFQEFLAQARAEEARIVESSRLHSHNKILPTPTEKRATGIEANYCLAVKDRPTTSIPSASRRGSLFEHVADYIKPGETGGVRRSMEANRRPVQRSQSPLKVNPNLSAN